MRSAEQIGRTVEEWHERQREQRKRTLWALLADLRRARESGAEWYRWIADGCRELTIEEYEALHPERARRTRRARLGRSA